MLTANIDQKVQPAEETNPFVNFPVSIEIRPHGEVGRLVDDLSPDIPWGDRQFAAKRLGGMRSLEALPGLLDALPTDPFWMVRCAIIQALEMIGDPSAIPTLQEVANVDGFQVVRLYAAKAIERLTPDGL